MCITLDPHDPNTLYVRTEPIDVFVSQDAGKSWTRLGSVRMVPLVESVGYPVPTVEPHVRDITVDPKDPKTIYIGLQVGYILKSTDGGASWKVLDVIDEAEPNTLYAALRNGELYASMDGGDRWKKLGVKVGPSGDIFGFSDMRCVHA